MKPLARYLRAFVGAARMTLRGEVVQGVQDPYPNLTAWWRGIIELTDAVTRTADSNGLPKPAREKVILRVEGRDTSMQTILAAVRFHAAEEFPLLMRRQDEFNYLTLQATVINDRFLIFKLAQVESLPAAVKIAIEKLSTHLETLPQKTNL